MITKQKARDIAENYLNERKTKYIKLDLPDQVKYVPNKKLLFGEKEGEQIDVYIVKYDEEWGLEHRLHGIYINASSGEILFTITPHGFLEK